MAESSGMEEALKTKVMGIPAWALGVVLSSLVIGVVVWRNRSKSKTPTTNPNDQASSTNGQDPNAVDPATGLTYGEEGSEDTQGFPTTPIDSYLAQNPTNSAYPTGLTPQGLAGPVTNQQWARIAADYLLAKGDDPSLVEGALDAYLKGSVLSTSQQAVVNLALQTFGSPPEGVKTPSTTGTSTSGAPATPQNLHEIQTGWKTGVRIAWNAVPNAAGYKVFRNGNYVGSNVPAGGSAATSYTDVGLKPNTSYTYTVDAFNTAGASPRSASITVKTAK